MVTVVLDVKIDQDALEPVEIKTNPVVEFWFCSNHQTTTRHPFTRPHPANPRRWPSCSRSHISQQLPPVAFSASLGSAVRTQRKCKHVLAEFLSRTHFTEPTWQICRQLWRETWCKHFRLPEEKSRTRIFFFNPPAPDQTLWSTKYLHVHTLSVVV